MTNASSPARQAGTRGRVLVACIAALALQLTPSRAGAGELRLTTRSLPCRDDSSIARELEYRLRSSATADLSFELLLQGEPDGTVTVRLQAGTEAMQRRVSVTSRDCDALASAAVLLVRDWLRDWGSEAPLPQPALDPDEAPAPTSAVPAPAAALARGAVRGRWRLAALAGSFLSADDGASGFEGALTFEHRLSPKFGLALGASYQSKVSQRLGPGAVSADLLGLGVGLVAPLLQREGGAVEVLTGPALCVLRLQSQGYPERRSAKSFSAAWTTGLRAAIALSAPLEWVTSLQLDLRSRSHVVRVAGAAGQLTVGTVRLSLATGLLWSLP